MSAHQNLHVTFELPNGNERRQRIEVIAGPINDPEKLAAFILHSQPDGTKLKSAVRLDTAGNELPGHPLTGPLRNAPPPAPFAPKTGEGAAAVNIIKSASNPAAPVEARQEPFPNPTADADVAKPAAGGSRATPRTL